MRYKYISLGIRVNSTHHCSPCFFSIFLLPNQKRERAAAPTGRPPFVACPYRRLLIFGLHVCCGSSANDRARLCHALRRLTVNWNGFRLKGGSADQIGNYRLRTRP